MMADFLGWIAAGAVLATFLMRTMAPLRVVAILSNVLFLVYGYIEHIYPVFVLHLALLPINMWRLFAVRDEARVPSAIYGPKYQRSPGTRRYAGWFVAGLLTAPIAGLSVIVAVANARVDRGTFLPVERFHMEACSQLVAARDADRRAEAALPAADDLRGSCLPMIVPTPQRVLDRAVDRQFIRLGRRI
jgi:hypothetical protein